MGPKQSDFSPVVPGIPRVLVLNAARGCSVVSCKTPVVAAGACAAQLGDASPVLSRLRLSLSSGEVLLVRFCGKGNPCSKSVTYWASVGKQCEKY